MADRVATYRWQLTADRGFDAAAAAVPGLAALGISHLYLSPVAEAVPGSLHGYDVTDPTRLREELGGPEGFARLAEAARTHGLSLLIDIVPNHLAAHHANPWWWDVLRLGAASRWAPVFDIDWAAPGGLVLPVLGDHYGRELEAGQLQLERGDRPDRVIVVRYHDATFPIRPEAEGAILAAVARAVDDRVLGLAARALARAESADALPEERDADLAAAERIALERLADPVAAAALDRELAEITADPERLDLVLARQHHRLARWTVADAEVDYRRFFDVDSLVATHMDGSTTFELLHRLPAELLEQPVVDGLRVDHVDGLADPGQYLAALRRLAGHDAWLLVEKILRHDEPLPPWPVEGTTGYEVADLLGGWLTDPVGAAALAAGWAARVGEARPYAEVALEARREVLLSGFAADLERVVDALHAVCRERRRHRDHTRAALRAVVVELAVHTPRYRTYVVPRSEGGPAAVDGADLAVVDVAAAASRAAAPELDPELIDLVTAVLTGSYTGPAEALVVTRFQQLTGPLAAKGEEDTALYRWLPLPHRCEVGADPSRPTVTAAEWHAACATAQSRWPERLTTLSTHDTKRSADARARLAALTGDPTGTLDAFDRWWATVEGATDGIVDVGSAWLAFHALVAAWPLDADRAWVAVRKSVREAGLRTSWTAPVEPFEDRLRAIVDRALGDGVARSIVLELLAAREEAGDVAALAQLLAQLLAPGVPDVYQGGERWDRSLVDPDNRRPPDDEDRASWVAQAASADAAQAWGDVALRRGGLPRAIVLHRALAARRRRSAVVGAGAAGAYVPLEVTGPDADRVLAFARGADPALAVVVARPGRTTAVDAEVALPPGEWIDAFTGLSLRDRPEVAKLLAEFPVALLER